MHDLPDRLRLRSGDAEDADAIAALHADRWRRHYRGAYSDSFLDADVLADRETVWTQRLRTNDGGSHTVLAEDGAGLVGFGHIVLDSDPRWGALLDNLHVREGHKRQGIGSELLALLAQAVIERIAIDLEPTLLRLAEQRARLLGAGVAWAEGDAQALPVDDGWADAVVSVFGAMYAPDHSAAAREMARAAAPDGRIVLAAWTPESLMSEMGAVLDDYLPPPPAASGPPSRWGDALALRLLLANAGATVTTTELHQVVLSFSDAREAAEFLVRTAGHVVSHRDALISSGRWRALHDDLAAPRRAT